MTVCTLNFLAAGSILWYGVWRRWPVAAAGAATGGGALMAARERRHPRRSHSRSTARSSSRRRRTVGTKADLVFETLKARLIAGWRDYGETLNTVEIAEEFGVSRRPVMDAMGRLEVAGFIEIIAQVGCRVIVPERRAVREHFFTAGRARRRGGAARGQHAPPTSSGARCTRRSSRAAPPPGRAISTRSRRPTSASTPRCSPPAATSG